MTVKPLSVDDRLGDVEAEYTECYSESRLKELFAELKNRVDEHNWEAYEIEELFGPLVK